MAGLAERRYGHYVRSTHETRLREPGAHLCRARRDAERPSAAGPAAAV